MEATIAEMTIKIEDLEKELQTQKTPISESKDVASEEFKCDKCGVVNKKEVTLRKHINTKHQIDPSDVDIIIQNNSNEKELKKARHHTRELEDRVENLTLVNSRLECEVRSLKKESDSLTILLSLRQNIDKPVPLSKRSQKKKRK